MLKICDQEVFILQDSAFTVSKSRSATIFSFGSNVLRVIAADTRSMATFSASRSYSYKNRYRLNQRKVVTMPSATKPTLFIPPAANDFHVDSSDYSKLPSPVRFSNLDEAELRLRHAQRVRDARSQRGRHTKAHKRFVEAFNRQCAVALAKQRKLLRPQGALPVAAAFAGGALCARILQRSVRKLVNHVHSRVDLTVDKLMDRVDAVADKVSTPANSLIHNIQEHVPRFVGCIRDAVIVSLLITAIAKKSAKFAAITAALAILLPGESVGARIVQRYLKKAQVELAPQASFDPRMIAVAAVVTLLGTTVFRKRSHRNTCLITTFLASIGNFDRLTTGWEGFITFFGHLIEKFIHFIGSLAGKDWNLKLIADPFPDITRLATSITQFATKVRLGSITPNCATVRSVRSFISDEAKLKLRHHNNRKAFQAMVPLTKDLAYLHEAFGPLITGKTGQRPQPPVVMLCGPPGIGKSLLTTDILDFVLSETLDPEVKAVLGNDYSGEMYLYPVEEDYANGYAGQACAIFEDVGLGVTALGDRKADFLRIASLANPYSKPLDQAAIAGKGNSFFQSDVIYCTTNVTHITAYVEGHIHEPKALIR
jgi:hypothetical protein